MIDRYLGKTMKKLFSLENRYQVFLDVELAVLKAYEASGIVPKGTYETAKANARLDVERIREIEASTRHDVVAFTRQISKTLGDEKRFFHYKLTSTDVVDTAQAVILRQANEEIRASLHAFIKTLEEKARHYKLTPCIGRTHGIHAEVTSFGLKLAYHVDIFKRLERKFQATRETLEVGKISGAVGNHAHVSIEVQDQVCQMLGIRSANISTQVIARDRHADYLSVLAQIGSALENLAVEIRHLSRSEVGEVEEGFAKGQKGSSAMPHKKNPVASENITGCARMLRGYMQMGFEDIALWHERDISHSSVERVALSDAVSLLDYMLKRFRSVIDRLIVHTGQMEKNIHMTKGLVFSQNVLHALIDKHISRDDAYDIVQPLALRAKEDDKDFEKVLKASPEIKKHLDEQEIEACFNYEGNFKSIEALFRRIGIPELKIGRS
ncbi:MAG: adenylosuccinate lyase [Candidatus Izemoplasmataceae bacterium]